LIAQKVSGIDETVSRLEIHMSDILTRMTDIEKVDAEVEEAALNTARALAEISGHWMRCMRPCVARAPPQVAPER
jgi:hypothetical protein